MTERAWPEGENKVEVPFQIGQQVRVRRSSGESEEGWRVFAIDTGGEEPRIYVENGKGIEKKPRVSTLLEWQKE